MLNPSPVVAFYLERFHQGDWDNAFHSLREQDHAILPELSELFRESTDTSLRLFLLHVIWQHRQPSVIPLLAEALHEPVAEIWKEAMDGLVALATAESLSALRQARARSFGANHERQRFNEWLEEAIGQAEESLSP